MDSLKKNYLKKKNHCIVATISTGQEIQCVPYVGFLLWCC